VQWIGLILIFAELTRFSDILWPPHERRGRKWIHPEFQLRFCSLIMTVSLGCLMVMAVLGWTYLKVTINEVAPGHSEKYLFPFWYMSSIFILMCLVGVFIFARSLSLRIAGPMLSFFEFLDSAMNGKISTFQVREGDEFQMLNQVARRFTRQVIARHGLNASPLEPGSRAPVFQGKTFRGGELDLRDYRGRKVWLCLYRYTGCALCASHIVEVESRLDELLKNNVHVIAVFEDKPAAAWNPRRNSDTNPADRIPIISDTDGEIYQAYRSSTSLLAVFHARVLWGGMKAVWSGFRQGLITGNIGRIPAHVLINEDGSVFRAYYGHTVADQIPWSVIDEFMKSRGSDEK
jgi:peroxiredoxin